jgi:hypothetical protein
MEGKDTIAMSGRVRELKGRASRCSDRLLNQIAEELGACQLESSEV